MKFFHQREATAFITTLLASIAFLVGAVKIWGVGADKLWTGLVFVLLMLALLIGTALLTVLVFKQLKKFRNK